jgi:putative cardiolipin synthase
VNSPGTEANKLFNKITRLIVACLLLTLGACAGAPLDYPKTASHTVPRSGDTQLGSVAIDWEQNHDELSGFVELIEGLDAIGARLKLTQLAEHTIDAQYFIVKKDRAGGLFSANLLLAADRGVRVRLLVDDIFSPGVDQAFTLLDTHPNVEVRLFNPLSRKGFKYWSYLTDFKRANRRMHNKSFTVDNAVTIVGGRNIGEEYFELNQGTKFDDYEVLALGPIVEDVSAGFDVFWNSALSIPMEAFGLNADSDELDKWREDMNAEIDRGTEGIYGQALDILLLEKIRNGTLQPVPAAATLVTDTPEKLQNAVGDARFILLAEETARRFEAANKEILIVTPYFIPQEEGAQLLEALLDKGVRVVIITNSLASTNHIPVYAFYSQYRERLLRAGAQFYEIRVDQVGGENAWGYKPDQTTLHTKATVIDRQTIFVGSLNFDPRSILINSEMGLFIESAEAAEEWVQVVESELDQASYRVELDEQGETRWTYDYAGQQEVYHKPPQTSWGRRFKAGFYSLLPIEDQL